MLCPQRPSRAAFSSLTAQEATTGNAPQRAAQMHHEAPPPPLKQAPLMHHTTVAVVPPDASWEHIQAARMLVRDKGLWRWPPHANLLYPFVAPRRFRGAAPVLLEALALVEPFDVRLRELRTFVHPRSATLWLHPEPAEPLVRLQAALERALPQCNAQTVNHGGQFTPHFTVGHFESEQVASEARERILASNEWPAEGVQFRVEEIVVMAREGADGQFEPSWRIPLGAAATSTVLEPILCHGERFIHMPSERFDFCERSPKASKWKRRRRRSDNKPTDLSCHPVSQG